MLANIPLPLIHRTRIQRKQRRKEKRLQMAIDRTKRFYSLANFLKIHEKEAESSDAMSSSSDKIGEYFDCVTFKELECMQRMKSRAKEK